ncbi:hypothetical protein [Microlunatus parietis]|uniref:Putative kinase n=1 Tax=Microlunatus parietis TaxID=682979 RepID=A0A7Y9IDT6_9ACTN|nr:hypothetical protein [Microlunatus parietis]NYE74945.1 putative kinase [Microlunatus parietis]
MVVPILASQQIDEASTAAIGYDICAEVAAQNVEAGLTVVVDGGNATHDRR